MQFYNPSAIVLQCGADSLAGDRLGVFNLSGKGHAACIEFVKSFNRPLVVLGGGGYSIRNVPRAWCTETAILVNHELNDGTQPHFVPMELTGGIDIPYNEYFEYYGPTYKITVEPSNMENLNTRKDLDRLIEKCTERIRGLNHAPSVPLQAVPGDWEFDESEPEEEEEKSEASGPP
jgi:histone deacetylase 1/2